VNNVSQVTTQVYQKVIADAGISVDIGSCETGYTLNGTASVGMDNLQYRWYPSELLNNPNSANPLFIPEPGQSQQFKLVVTSTYDGYYDIDSSYVTITVADVPIARAGEDWEPDNNDPVLLDGSNSTGAVPLTYEWTTIDREGNVIVLADTDTVTVNRSGAYYLTVTDRYNCSVTDRMNVIYPIDPYIAIDDTVYTYQQQSVDIYILRNDIIDEDDRYDLDALYFPLYPSHGQLVQSNFGSDTVLTYIPEPYYHGPDTFIYIMDTELSPDDEATVFIQVLERRPVMPEGFSPNGDGINDLLIIENIELYEQNSLIIFNRWGNIVYEKDKYDNSEAWDGIANKGIRVGSGPLPAGVYFYILDLGPDERIVDRIIKGNLYIASGN